MTLQNSSAERPRRAGYFFFLLRQNWPAIVTNSIIFLLLNVVFLAMMYAVMLPETIREWSASAAGEQIARNVRSTLDGMAVANTVIASLLAVLWGGTALSYLNNKVGVNFYHALPRRREILYLEEAAVKFICLAVPLFVSCLIAVPVTGAMVGKWASGYAVQLFRCAGYGTLYFALYFSIMLFAASFTGTGFARILTAGYTVFMPSGVLGCVILVLSMNAVHRTYDGLYELALRLLLPYRTIFTVSELDEKLNAQFSDNAWEILLTIGLTLVFLAVGLLIYRRRKSELSGTPVLLPVASGIIKYTGVFCAAVLMGTIFKLLDGWFMLGAGIGALLALMVINTILTKSAKQMFAGWKGFLIFLAVFIAFYLVFGLDLVGLDTHVPSSAFIRGGRVAVDGTSYTLTRGEADRFGADLEACLKKAERETDVYDDYYYGDYHYPTAEENRIWVYIGLDCGLFEAGYRLSVCPTDEEGGALIRDILYLEDFERAYFRTDTKWDQAQLEQLDYTLWLGSPYDGVKAESARITGMPEILGRMIECFRADREGFFQTPVIAWIQYDSVYNSNYRDYDYYINGSFPCYGVGDEFLDDVAAMAESVTVNYNDEVRYETTDRAKIREILASAVLQDSYSSFTMIEPGWTLMIDFVEGEEGYRYGDYYDKYGYAVRGFFLEGKVPAFLQ